MKACLAVLTLPFSLIDLQKSGPKLWFILLKVAYHSLFPLSTHQKASSPIPFRSLVLLNPLNTRCLDLRLHIILLSICSLSVLLSLLVYYLFLSLFFFFNYFLPRLLVPALFVIFCTCTGQYRMIVPPMARSLCQLAW